jgi:hypothetical protein
MASLTQIRTALESTISAAVSGIQGYATVPEVTNLPAFVVVPRSSEFGRAMGRGLDGYTFDVIVLVSRSDDQLAQAALDPFVNGFGSSSIRQAVWNTRTLGLTDGTEATVTGMSDYGAPFDVGDIDNVGARLTVEVLTSGTA